MPEALVGLAGGAPRSPPAPLRVVCLGECMVELREHAPGLFAQGFAGDTFNTAVYLKRLSGADVVVDYASGVGRDAFADDMLRCWRDEGIGTSLMRRVDGPSTGLYSIRTDANGERHFSYWRESSAARAYFDAAITPLESRGESRASGDGIDLLYLSGISLAVMTSALPERLPALISALRARGATIAFDNNYRPRLWSDVDAARAAFATLYALADIAFVTLDDESALQGDAAADERLPAVLDLPCAELVVKRGPLPTLVRTASGRVEVPVEPVARVVDTTAAGDAFAAGYLGRRLLAGAEPAAAAAFANQLAGVVIGERGAIVARAVTDRFLEREGRMTAKPLQETR